MKNKEELHMNYVFSLLCSLALLNQTARLRVTSPPFFETIFIGVPHPSISHNVCLGGKYNNLCYYPINIISNK